MEMRQYFELNDKENTYEICGMQLKIMLRGKCIAFNTDISKNRKQERLKISELSFQAVKNSPFQEVKEQIKPKETRRKET